MKDQKMTQKNLQLADGTVRMAPADIGVFPVTGATSPKVVTFNNVKKIQKITHVAIVGTGGVRRGASGAVTITNNNQVSVTDAAFANGEELLVEVVGYNA